MPNQPDVHGASILIVDDCSDTGSVLCELLKQSGYKNVSAATDGSALLCVDTANYYSLLLLDMHMPKLGGLEIMQQLHRKQTRNCVPVIAISGDQRYRTVAIAAGAYAFLIKPFNPGNWNRRFTARYRIVANALFNKSRKDMAGFRHSNLADGATRSEGGQADR